MAKRLRLAEITVRRLVRQSVRISSKQNRLTPCVRLCFILQYFQGENPSDSHLSDLGQGLKVKICLVRGENRPRKT